MTAPAASEPPTPNASNESASFGLIGWQLAMADTCAECDRRTNLCPACASALDELILEERRQHRIDLHDQVREWKNARLLSPSAAQRLWRAIANMPPVDATTSAQ